MNNKEIEHQCGGPAEACCQPGCEECGMPPIGPFAVVAHRWGMRDAHSYVVGVFVSLSEAIASAAQTVDDRGGKYGCEVTDCSGEQLYYFESPYFGYGCGNDPAKKGKALEMLNEKIARTNNLHEGKTDQ